MRAPLLGLTLSCDFRTQSQNKPAAPEVSALPPILTCNEIFVGVVCRRAPVWVVLAHPSIFAEGQTGSDIKGPSQAYNEYPRPTDRRGGNSGEIKPFKDAKAHALNPKQGGQLEEALSPIEFAG